MRPRAEPRRLPGHHLRNLPDSEQRRQRGEGAQVGHDGAARDDGGHGHGRGAEAAAGRRGRRRGGQAKEVSEEESLNAFIHVTQKRDHAWDETFLRRI